MKLIIILFFISLTCFSQVNDSLIYQLSKIENDTERVNQLYKTGFDIRNTDPEMSYKIAAMCQKEALESKSAAHLAKSYNLLGLLFYKKGDYTQALQFQNKALKLNESINNQYGIAINQANLGNIYSETNYPKLAETAYLKSLQAANETGNTLQMTRCLVNIGVLKYNQKLYNVAIKQFQEALVFAKSIGHHELTADCHNNIGAIYKEQNKLDSALLYLEEGLKTRQMIDDEFELADSYNNIAMVYVLQKNFSQASNYIALSQEICEKFNYTDALLELYHTQSEFYSAQQNFEQANIYLKKHYTLKDSISNLGKELKTLIFSDNSSKNETTKPEGNSKYGFIIILLILLFGIPLFLIRFKR